MPNQNKEDKNQDNQIKNNQKNKNESKNNINNKKDNQDNNGKNINQKNNQNNQKNNINNNINNNKNNNKKTRKKIIIPKIKDIQTTPDTSLLHPILEDNLVMCIHGGKVNLKAKNAKRIQSNNIPIMLNNEIQGASISGCFNPPILGGPCSKVILVLPYTYSNHKVNNKHSVHQMGLIGVSDKGYPIFAIPKKNAIKFSLAKIKANPLSKLEYEKIQWEGVGEKRSNTNKISMLPQKNNKIKPILYIIEFISILFNGKNKKSNQLKENRKKGKKFEEKDFKIFKKECPNAQSQVTLGVYEKNNLIVKTRVDAMACCKGKIIIREAKASKSAPLTPNHETAFNLISKKNDDITIELRGNKTLKCSNKILKSGDKLSSKDVIIQISRPNKIIEYTKLNKGF